MVSGYRGHKHEIKFTIELYIWFTPCSTAQYINKTQSVSRFQEKEKRGEMITINDNIK
jgi:hypothetical protein